MRPICICQPASWSNTDEGNHQFSVHWNVNVFEKHCSPVCEVGGVNFKIQAIVQFMYGFYYYM